MNLAHTQSDIQPGPPRRSSTAPCHCLYLLLLCALQDNQTLSPLFVSVFVPLLPLLLLLVLLLVLLRYPDTMEVSWRCIQESFFLSASRRFTVCRTQSEQRVKWGEKMQDMKLEVPAVIFSSEKGGWGGIERRTWFVNKEAWLSETTLEQMDKQWLEYISAHMTEF